MVRAPRRVLTRWRIGILVLLAGILALAYSRWLVFEALSVHRAAASGDVPALRTALLRHPDMLNAKASFELDKRRTLWTPLMWAVRGENPDAVAYLLSLGANVNASDRFGITPLWIAVDAAKPKIVDLLLRAKADPRAPTTFGSSPLMCAVIQGEIEIAQSLLEAGADPNARGLAGTPLFQAVRAGQVESVALLVSRGATIGDAKHQRLLLEAASHLEHERMSAIKKILLTTPDPDSEAVSR